MSVLLGTVGLILIIGLGILSTGRLTWLEEITVARIDGIWTVSKTEIECMKY